MITISASLMIQRRTPRTGKYLFIPWKIRNAEIAFIGIPPSTDQFATILWCQDTRSCISKSCTFKRELRLRGKLKSSAVCHVNFAEKDYTSDMYSLIIVHILFLNYRKFKTQFCMYRSWLVPAVINFFILHVILTSVFFAFSHPFALLYPEA